MRTVVIIGPAHPLRGGIATFNHRLGTAYQEAGWNVTLFSFSLQYPGFLFPGTSQFSTDPAPPNLDIHPKINSINPLNWLRVGHVLRKRKPDLVLVRYWLPFMGPALGTLLRLIRKNRHSQIIAITDNVLPHEKRPGDHLFTTYFLRACDGFITMSEPVLRQLRQFEPHKPAVLTFHPLYDHFGEPVAQAEARQFILGEPAAGAVLLLFFGFIRRYKGLDLLLEAMQIVKQQSAGGRDIRLIVAGEFYEDAAAYHEQIQRLGIADVVILKTDFIPDQQVRYYFSAADVVVQPYRNATQSGVTPLAYHFEKPMIVTRVGALADYVPHGKVGLVAEPDVSSIAAAILTFVEQGAAAYLPHVRSEKRKYSWEHFIEAITELSGRLDPDRKRARLE